MMPPKAKSENEKKKLVSARYAVMYLPNTHWDFYDAYMRSQPCTAARVKEELSTEGGNLHKYIKLTYKQNQLEKQQKESKQRVHVPTMLTQLLALQKDSGKFEELDAVLQVLQMPSSATLRNSHLYTEWEVATSFAVAAMRQEIYLFDQLAAAHDRAVQWLPGSELVPEAREVIHNLMGTRNQPQRAAISNYGEDDSKGRQVNHDEDEEEREREELRRLLLKQQRQLLKSHLTLSRVNTAATTISALDSPPPPQQETEDQLIINVPAAESEEEEEEDIINMMDAFSPPPGSPMTPSGASLERLRSKLHELTIERDEEAIAAQQKIVDNVKLEIIDIYLKIEKLTLAIINCMHRCIKNYINCEKNRVRYVQFNELTCRLGEGKAPQAGFDDWRLHGVPGIRPLILDFFNKVQLMAEERMLLIELENPTGLSLEYKPRDEEILSKWKIIWHGEDLVEKVIHNFDFLRKCRELSEWYGPSYYFTSNPLTLPIPMAKLYNLLRGMNQLVLDQQESLPFKRKGIMNIHEKREWKHEQFLNRFRRDFQSIEEEWIFNWPTMPQVREEEDNERMFTALLVMYVTHKDHLEAAYLAEKKLIGTLATKRGQEKHLIGSDTAKVDRKLFLPPVDKRKHRPVDPIQASNKANHPRYTQMSGRSNHTAGIGGSGMGSKIIQQQKQKNSSIASFSESQTATDYDNGDEKNFAPFGSSMITAETNDSSLLRPHHDKAEAFQNIVSNAQQDNKIASAAATALLLDNTAPAVIQMAKSDEEKSIESKKQLQANSLHTSAEASINQEVGIPEEEDNDLMAENEQRQLHKGKVRSELGLRVRSADEIPPALLKEKRSMSILKRANSEKVSTDVTVSKREAAATTVRPLLVQDRRRRGGPVPAPSPTPVPTPSSSSKNQQLPTITTVSESNGSNRNVRNEEKLDKTNSMRTSLDKSADKGGVATRNMKRKSHRISKYEGSALTGGASMRGSKVTVTNRQRKESAVDISHGTKSRKNTLRKKDEQGIDLQNIARAASRHKKRSKIKSAGLASEASQSDESGNESIKNKSSKIMEKTVDLSAVSATVVHHDIKNIPLKDESIDNSKDGIISKKRVSISENSVRSKESSLNEATLSSGDGIAHGNTNLPNDKPQPTSASFAQHGSIDAASEHSFGIDNEEIIRNVAAATVLKRQETGLSVGNSIPPPPSTPPSAPGTPLRSALVKGGRRRNSQSGDSPLITRFQLDTNEGK